MHSMMKFWLLLLLATGLSKCEENLCPPPADIYPCACSSSSLGFTILCDGDRKVISIDDLKKNLNSLSGRKIKFLALSSFNMEEVLLEFMKGLAVREVDFNGTDIVEMPAFNYSENTLQIMHSMIKSSSLHLTPGLSQCEENQCPDPADIYPCRCSFSSFGFSVLCDGNRNVISIEDLQKPLKSLSGKKIKFLALSSFNMEEALSEFLNGLPIQGADFNGTNIKDMPNLSCSENTLQIMYSMQKSSFLLFLVARLSEDKETLCPAPADIYPCACSSNNLGLRVLCDGEISGISNESLRKTLNNFLLQKALNSLRGKKIRFLLLDSFNMEEESSDFLNRLDIQVLYLYQTLITKMPTLKGSENTIQALTLKKVVSDRLIPNFSLNVSHLKELKFLDFRENYLTNWTDNSFKAVSVGNDWFRDGPSSLEIVKIHSKVKSFGDHVFSELANLKEIDLTFNQIEELHRSMFPDPAEQLLVLDLQRNKIKSLPEDMFVHMPVLTTVYVWENPIIVLDETTWRPVWEQLEVLGFGGAYPNPLPCDDSTISWTFNFKRPKGLSAFCSRSESYKEYRGRWLEQIIDEKQGFESNKN